LHPDSRGRRSHDLTKKADKGYLALTRDGLDGFVIVAEKAHAAELAQLFAQYAIPCRLHSDVAAGHDTLHFDADKDIGRVEEVLDGYKEAKGS
jgi:hypothetical protein